MIDEAETASVASTIQGNCGACLLKRTPLILLSPISPTRSHPRLAADPAYASRGACTGSDRSQLAAFGGMDQRRFSAIEPLGFYRLGGIDAWLRT